ncbi:group I intron-associated PD-(D/E)XK endonuclease [Neobacillus rhizosphaerae]|uniref:group I intron-associated PD-(D/E)XK endonuclease n=1 Tax=Neobacillus rhizosphaerae TaxID=2880965 RepID=UPI003D26D280
MNTAKKNAHMVGTVSELSVMLEYAKRGYTINLPTTPARYDFIAEKEGRSVKVQVKHGSTFNGERELLGFSKTPYEKKDVDVIAMFDSNDGTIYYIPTDHVEGMSSIRLRIEPYLYSVKSEKALIADHYRKFIG